MCRDRAAKRPQDLSHAARLPGLLRSPVATQGRSYMNREQAAFLATKCYGFNPCDNRPQPVFKGLQASTAFVG